MAGLDENGLTIKRLPDILAELEDALRLQFGSDLDLTENSLFGILNTIYGASVAGNWELAQAIYNAFNIDTATGKQLDDLAALLNLVRLQPTKGFGDLNLFGTSGTVVPIGTQFSDSNGNTYLSTTVGTLNTETSRTAINIAGAGGNGTQGELSTTFQITINGDVYSNQFLWSEPTSETFVADTLRDLIGDQPDYTSSSLSEANPEFIKDPQTFFNTAQGVNDTANTFLNVINKDETKPITITVLMTPSPTPSHESSSTPFIGVSGKVSTFSGTTDVQASTSGVITTNANTLSTIDTPVTGLASVNNPDDIITGRALETDEELRSRFKESSTINGASTIPSIEANLRQIEGVTKAFVVENELLITDSNGRPGKSYEAIIIGGTDEDIGNVIWDTKPAGIETFGTSSFTVVDSENRQHVVKFSRPESVFLWVKANYTKYSEEVFPSDGESSMADAILTQGQSLELGEDVISGRFFGPVYSSAEGIQDLTITLATSTDATTEPPLTSFSINTIEIDSDELAAFESARIEIIEE